MSIGTTHTISQLTKNSVAIDGQRLVRLIAKGGKTPNLGTSMCVSIPTLGAEQVAEYIDSLLPYVVGWVQGVQDKIVRNLRVDEGRDSIQDSDIDMPAVISWLSENGEGEKLSATDIVEWFNAEYKEVACNWIRSRPGMSDISQSVVEQKFAAVRDVMSTFAHNSKSRQSKPILNMVLGFASAVECDGRLMAIAAAAQKKLDAMNVQNDALDGLI